MANRVVITVPRYKGEYELDADGEPFTTLEWRWIKKISGYLPLTIADGLAGGDPDVVLALAVIALVRAGKVDRQQALDAADTLADAPVDGAAIQLLASVEEEAADESPPDQPPAISPPSRNGGESSSPTSDSPANGQSRTGLPDSERSAISGQAISAI